MSQKKEIESNSGLVVKVSKYGSPRIAQLLKNTVFGTEGKLRYKQNEIVERVKSQANVQFIEILKGKRVLGTVGMSNRSVKVGDEAMHSLYVRYLSIAQPFKSRKRTSFKNETISKKKKGSLRELISNEITNHFEQPFIENERKGAFYAYVESANLNSRNLCISMGFHPTRKVETLVFSRFYPNQKRYIQNIAHSEQGEVKQHLKDFYHNHAFYFEDQIFNTGFYLVKKVNGKIVGGIRAIPVNWELIDYPGFEGWLMRDILPFLPFTSRLFHPTIFKFLAFDYAWHIPNHEYLIPELMSHCCSIFGINTGMIWGDMQSELIKNLKSGNELGFIHSVVGSVYADLMIRPINFIKDKVEEESLEPNDFDEEIDSELEFPPKELLNDEQDENCTKKQECDDTDKESVAEITTYTNEQASGRETSEENESISTSEETIKNSSSHSEEESAKQSNKDDLEELREVLKRPVFVSALDMT